MWPQGEPSLHCWFWELPWTTVKELLCPRAGAQPMAPPSKDCSVQQLSYQGLVLDKPLAAFWFWTPSHMYRVLFAQPKAAPTSRTQAPLRHGYLLWMTQPRFHASGDLGEGSSSVHENFDFGVHLYSEKKQPSKDMLHKYMLMESICHAHCWVTRKKKGLQCDRGKWGKTWLIGEACDRVKLKVLGKRSEGIRGIQELFRNKMYQDLSIPFLEAERWSHWPRGTCYGSCNVVIIQKKEQLWHGTSWGTLVKRILVTKIFLYIDLKTRAW
jgi:hypothetical protein